MHHDKEETTVTAAELEELKKQIDEKECKLEEQKNQILRLMADFDNFKKRAASERDEIICFSNEVLVLELLPILDNFERALSHAEKDPASASSEFMKGMALIKRQLQDVLTKVGLSPVEAIGKQFDPYLHEAVLTRESDQEDNIVVEEMQKGYKLKEKVIRPSMVIVSKKGAN